MDRVSPNYKITRVFKKANTVRTPYQNVTRKWLDVSYSGKKEPESPDHSISIIQKVLKAL